MTILSEIAATLQTTEANAINRVMRMKLYVTYCGRCGGSGHYSRNAEGDTRCYSCKGVGGRLPTASEYEAVLENCKAAAADGRLADYLRFQDALRVTKNARQQVLKAWRATGIADAYDWTKAARYSSAGMTEFKRDREIADINAKMAAAYGSVSDASMKLNSKSATYQADVIAFAETVKQALDAIAVAEVEFQNYLQNNR